MKLKINWVGGLIVFFIIFFIWVFSFVFFAMRQTNDLVSDDYYQKGAKYSEQISINQRSVPYQDSLQINLTGNQVTIELSKSLISSGDSLEVYFFKSSDKTKDLRFHFRMENTPILIERKLLVQGRYQIYFTWNNQNEKYMITKSLDVP